MTSASTTSCEFCGSKLTPLSAQAFGHEVFIGYEPCTCDRAQKRMREKITAGFRDELEKWKEREDKRLEAAGIPKRYRELAHKDAAKYAEMVKAGESLYLTGNVGVGKTTLAASIAKELLKSDRFKSLKMTSAWKILDEIKQSFGTDDDPIVRYQTASVLVLDDLGKESPTEFALERLFALVDERENNMLPTIVTSQYSPENLGKKLAKHGDYDTAIAIISRLRHDCELVELTGEDRRC